VSQHLYLLQRLTALLLAPLVLIHMALIAWAMGDGLSGGEILARTRGSLGWGLFYGVFVGCAALHGAIGLRTVGREWLRLDRLRAGGLGWLALLLLLALGLRAVLAVTGGGA